jgi:hypothetical protein
MCRNETHAADPKYQVVSNTTTSHHANEPTQAFIAFEASQHTKRRAQQAETSNIQSSLRRQPPTCTNYGISSMQQTSNEHANIPKAAIPAVSTFIRRKLMANHTDSHQGDRSEQAIH